MPRRDLLVGNGIFRYLRAPSDLLRERFRRKAVPFITFAVLAVLTLMEDTVVMVRLDPHHVADTALLEILYRRNLAETVLALGVAFYTASLSVDALSLKGTEKPRPTNRQAALIGDILPYFARRHSLAPREVEILEAMIQGDSNVQIAQRFQVSVGTVKTHTSHIFRKTGVPTARSCCAPSGPSARGRQATAVRRAADAQPRAKRGRARSIAASA